MGAFVYAGFWAVATVGGLVAASAVLALTVAITAIGAHSTRVRAIRWWAGWPRRQVS